ncbi:hypothetical protein J1G35_02245 [Pseudomonas sp. SH10-3B]|uniref:hypothetical protein n=1 Tax=Pseudomonas sp. SH10-3B TaxID=2816049 RepID=UPI001CA7140E|nr:hypothetical protein [Pseudomonas sp. SH10-3B]MBY8944667.1 hypothetical protein [Pseudomonas sp. SH10-3B]
MFGFFSGRQKEINRGFYGQLARRDQDAFLQHLYDKGHSVLDISKEMAVTAPNIYNRIAGAAHKPIEPAWPTR